MKKIICLQYDCIMATCVHRNVRVPKFPSQLHKYKIVFQIQNCVFLVYPYEPKLEFWFIVKQKKNGMV